MYPINMIENLKYMPPLAMWKISSVYNNKCFQYGKISNFILVQLNINHAMYVLNFLHVERGHIFEVFNHIYNAIFKYNVKYYSS
jgi:hypothetical protein